MIIGRGRTLVSVIAICVFAGAGSSKGTRAKKPFKQAYDVPGIQVTERDAAYNSARELCVIGSDRELKRRFFFGTDGVHLIMPDKEARHAAVVQVVSEEDWHSSPPRRFGVLRYFGPTGRELWKRNICCDIGKPFWNRVAVSEAGTFVAIWDGDAAGACMDPLISGGYQAPSWCQGLRVFSRSGKLIMAKKMGGSPFFSPEGKYVLTVDRTAGRRFYEVKSKTGFDIPRGNWGQIESIGDDGIIVFRPIRDAPRYLFEAGKGLRREKQTAE